MTWRGLEGRHHELFEGPGLLLFDDREARKQRGDDGDDQDHERRYHVPGRLEERVEEHDRRHGHRYEG